MTRRLVRLGSILVACLPALSCTTPRHAAHGDAGTLLIVGGGLDNDSRPIYERFVELASARGPANVVIVTAATGPQDIELADKTEALRVWAPGVPTRGILRETTTADSVAAIDAATALLFTGGDQQRITARYRPDDRDTAEWLAMRRLLARGGVIAGCSAGDAMMGEWMLVGGGSAAALGIPPADAEERSSTVLGPRVARGMHFLPWAMTDSHFFERDRVGRLVAALEATGTRFGLGVGEDGCVEVDLATGDLVGVGVSESLLVDAAHVARDGAARRGLLACVIEQGTRINLLERLASVAPAPPPQAGTPRDVPVVEPGQNRQLASWRLFRCADRAGGECVRLALEGWQVTAWPNHDDGAAFEVGPR